MTPTDLARGARPPAPGRLLLVEDDGRVRAEVAAALRRGGFSVEVAGSLAEARRLLATGFDALLLDLGLPDGDGLSLCAELRERDSEMPIVVLSARDAPDQRVLGIEVGADDYLTKPFHVPELIARLHRLLRRKAPRAESDTVRVGELWADPGERRAGRGRAETFALAPREFDLLLFLMRNPGRTWTRRQLIERVWGQGWAGHERAVDLHVARVRLAVEKNPRDPQHVETVWGSGYRFREAP